MKKIRKTIQILTPHLRHGLATFLKKAAAQYRRLLLKTAQVCRGFQTILQKARDVIQVSEVLFGRESYKLARNDQWLPGRRSDGVFGLFTAQMGALALCKAVARFNRPPASRYLLQQS